MKATTIERALKELADPERAKISQRFFKTGDGEYGAGDLFLGIRVPALRAQVKQFETTDLAEAEKLLRSPFHEVRLFAVFLLVRKFTRGSDEEKKAIYTLYLNNTELINNWDLVDSSAYQIVGYYLENRDRNVLYKLARSNLLWERRIAIIATYRFIKNGQFDDTLALSELLLDDAEDLMHKAVGWMLREVGNRDPKIEKDFLKKHYKNMPRTMLRYAIEKFPKEERKQYL